MKFLLCLSGMMLASSLSVSMRKPKTKAVKEDAGEVVAEYVAQRKLEAQELIKRIKPGANSANPHQETAFVNFIRHGEDCHGNKAHLGKYGVRRAKYMARCMSSGKPSLIMPFGHATSVFAARVNKNHTFNPILTAEPFTNITGLELKVPCVRSEDELDLRHFARCQAPYVMKSLVKNGVTNIYMTKHEMPYLVKALNIPNGRETFFQKWPKAGKMCRSQTQKWSGEFCDEKDPDADPPNSKKKGISCMDLIWQVEFTRDSHEYQWRAVQIRRLFQEFHGMSENQACEGDLAPIEFAPAFPAPHIQRPPAAVPPAPVKTSADTVSNAPVQVEEAEENANQNDDSQGKGEEDHDSEEKEEQKDGIQKENDDSQEKVEEDHDSEEKEEQKDGIQKEDVAPLSPSISEVAEMNKGMLAPTVAPASSEGAADINPSQAVQDQEDVNEIPVDRKVSASFGADGLPQKKVTDTSKPPAEETAANPLDRFRIPIDIIKSEVNGAKEETEDVKEENEDTKEENDDAKEENEEENEDANEENEEESQPVKKGLDRRAHRTIDVDVDGEDEDDEDMDDGDRAEYQRLVKMYGNWHESE